MSDKLFPLNAEQLLEITFRELLHKDSFFGIPRALFFKPARLEEAGSAELLYSRLYGKTLHTPLGVAAGPHSQMAQNIVAAWLLGARYIELKTVQTLDELEVAKPCIDMQDEGYNCEWSQELKIKQSFDEYLNAWIIIHILNHHFGRGTDPGVIFNMSVGYDMAGILNKNVQWFFRQMEDCSEALEEKKAKLRTLYPAVDEAGIPSRISDNVTLSTMHGCPANEIESIAAYLMEEKKLHTLVKLNPTLLGPERLRTILNDKLGWQTHVPDQAFEHDLQMVDALRIINHLLSVGKKNSLAFGLKLTNTLESVNHKDVFDRGVESMYMSGRALHPLAVSLAHRLQEDFEGRLHLSFSGGADAFNVTSLLACGFKTITTCTDLLKPGGMMRLPQYLENITGKMQQVRATSLHALVCIQAGVEPSGPGETANAVCRNLKGYAEQVLKEETYQRNYLVAPDIKTSRGLELFDCISAPCRDTCATRQDIPEYMLHTSRKEFIRAHEVILRTNPFPAVTGMICDHLCQNKCTRVHYDNPLLIREVKRFNARQPEPEIQPAPANGLRASVIGAGPAGLSCAYFLALAGFAVNVYESASKAGGMVQYAIPGFRLTDEAMDKDLKRIKSLGVVIQYNTRVDKTLFEKLRGESDYVFVGTGAPLSTPLPIEGIDSEGVLDPLQLLFRIRAGQPVNTGHHVVIIGGGNTAMDAARTAYRLVGETGTVTIVYRRTINEMPADQGEIKAALAEGIKVMELCGPEKVIAVNGKVQALQCAKMELKEADASGRPKPVKIENSEFEVPCDTIIPAVGQLVETGFVDTNALKTEKGTYLTRIGNVFTGGDAMRGASTAINAIGDGRKAAEQIIQTAGLEAGIPKPPKNNPPGHEEIMVQRAKRAFGPRIKELPLTDRKNFKLVQTPLEEQDIVREAQRCLQCDELCNTCVTVCPNLANHAYQITPKQFNLQKAVQQPNGQTVIVEDGHFSVTQPVQILTIANFCNECGNCNTFCPSKDAPYKTKPRVHLNIASFYDSKEGYYLSRLEKSKNLIGKKNGQLFTLSEKEDIYLYETQEAIIALEKENFHIRNVQFLTGGANEVSLRQAAQMHFILQGADNFIFA